MSGPRRRPPATIVILAWNAWESTRACLESLRPTLGVRDQVVVVDNGSVDATASQLPKYPWVEVVTNAENRGFAGGCNQGASLARHELLVFLNNDTVLTGRWLDSLLAPFEHESVGATGPRSNFVSGPQIVSGADYRDMASLRAFVRVWTSSHRDETSDTDRLVGFCLAVRRQAFESIGGFDTGYEVGGYEDDDLCRRLTGAGWQLKIAHGSFVHHSGHATFDANGVDWAEQERTNRQRFLSKFSRGENDGPLVSACLIVKDEEDNLPACLASMKGVADEVIVYDTGSSDATVEVARRAGATVIEGYWDHDFGRARNAALEHCRGEWILWLDADETLECDDRAALQDLLARTKSNVDAWSVAIENLTGAGVGAGFVHHAARLFRRENCEWVGRLHEQVARRVTHEGISQAILETASIRHTGYLDKVMVERDKAARNLQLAEREVAEADNIDLGFSLTSLGRSMVTAGRFDEAVSRCTEALEHTDNAITRRLALRTIAEAHTITGAFDDAEQAVARLREASGDPVQADVVEVKLALARGNAERALALLDGLGPAVVDEDGFEYSKPALTALRADALSAVGRHGDSADAWLSVLGSEGILDAHIGVVVDELGRAGRPLGELARALPADRIVPFLAQSIQLAPDIADSVLEACLEELGDPTAVLAASATLARRLPLERALVWSARLRGHGMAESCPLVAIAARHPDPVLRARAGATAARAFGDDRADQLVRRAYAAADPAQREQIRDELQALAPELAAGLGESDPARSPGIVTTDLAATATARVATHDPKVSIVIPCFDRAELTLACLQSIAANPSTVSTELIVVDNGSTDGTRQLSGLQDDGFRVLRNETNEGFGPACNQAARAAAGEYVLFLNNDTVVTPGWLEPLVDALDEDPRLAAVQPKLLYPDGRLNDAGGLVFADGEAWVYGKGAPDPAAPPYDCRRSPDYVSGACLLVRASAFAEVGGFDDRFAPAYYEDTDLSFALRAAGWKTLYEPASVVVHIEGGTAGTDLGSGLKQYQSRNKAIFAQKWSDELAWRPALDPSIVEAWAHRAQGGFGPGEELPAATPAAAWAAARGRAGAGHSVLVVDQWLPAFDRASGSLRLFTLLRCLRQAGHDVTFFATTRGEHRYARELGRLGIASYGAVPELEHGGARGKPALEAVLAERRFDTVILTPWITARLEMEKIRRLAPGALVLVDTNDVHFCRLERAAALSGDPNDLAHALEVKTQELDTYRRADRVICVTEDDAQLVRASLDGTDVVIVPNAHALIDPGPGFSERRGCLFVGNFNHAPNCDAVQWWSSEIGGRLARHLPGALLTVVGNDPRGVAAAMAGPGIDVVGTVHSTVPFLHAARVSVAPLRYGAGMKGKVGEALAAGLPVVATSVAVEGMGLRHGENVLVADIPEAFAESVARLYEDDELWHRLREAGRAHVERHLGVDRMREAVGRLLVRANGQAPGRRETRRSDHAAAVN